MKFTPYPFQKLAVDHAVNFLRSASPGEKQLYSAPTGCGKSVVELLVHGAVDRAFIVTPRDEIVVGMMEKLGDPDGCPDSKGVWTPVRLRNRLLSGDVQHPNYLVFDETHHHNANTWQQLDLLTGVCPAVGYTATPYRGTPKSTREFREVWGDPLPLITYQEAADEGYIRMPSYSILPLVDDDVVEVRGGEFDVTSIESATVDRLGDLVEHSRQWCKGGEWDRATIFAFPSSVTCAAFQQLAGAKGLPVAVVSADTPKAERFSIFRAVEEGILALAHINIVSEGVDLKLRRLVDAAPTLSPVKWVQQLGRITRPWSEQPEYVCTNRNVLRHAYALEGCVPVGAVADAEKKFGPTQRAHTRVLGLEAIGRFKPAVTKLVGGLNLYTYSMSTVVGNSVLEFCCLVHPVKDPVWAIKTNTKNDDGVKSWGKWERCDPPTDLVGFSSVGNREPSEKQQAWWNRSARRFGLDPDQELTRKSFQALPVLSDIQERM